MTATDMLPDPRLRCHLAGTGRLQHAGNRSTRHPGGPEVDGGRGDASRVYRKLAGDRDGTFLLESAEHGGVWSRWSIVGQQVAPRSPSSTATRTGSATLRGVPVDGIPTDALRDTIAALATAAIEGPATADRRMVGMVGYDAVRRWERLPVTAPTPWVSPSWR